MILSIFSSGFWFIFPSVFRVCQLSLDFICLPVNLSIVCPVKDFYFHTDSFTSSLLLLHLDLSLRILSINSGYMSQLNGNEHPAAEKD